MGYGSAIAKTILFFIYIAFFYGKLGAVFIDRNPNMYFKTYYITIEIPK
jgi:hypothetical protein